jgi:flagellar hook-basal body complex protein FliE
MSDPLGLINNSGGAGHINPARPVRAGARDTQGPDFKDVLMKNIEQVNKLQQDAELAIEDLQTGKRDDVDAVMIAKQKADTAFQMLLQVRNSLVDAYQEIKDMRV